VAFADLFLGGAEETFAGVRHNSERVGEVATEMLVRLMQENVCGTPAVPTATLVEGVWCDGPSLPARQIRPDPLEEMPRLAIEEQWQPVA
jgi:hypothetical protein